MKIAHVTDFYLPRLGGIEIHIAGLAAHQRLAGHDVDVISVGGLVESTDRGRPERDRGTATLDSFHPRAIRSATSTVLDGDYDAVHVHAGLATPLAFRTARVASRAGLPTVVTMHSMIGRLAPLYRVANDVTSWNAWPVAWTAVSDMAASPLRHLLGGERCVTVLPNAVDTDAWANDPVRHADGHVRIVAVTRLAPRKRPMELLRILRRVRQATPDQTELSATIIGEGAEHSSMERYLARHDMSSWVSLPGRLTHAEIRGAFRHTDIFVAPAIQESFGIAALEARAAGLPVVAMERAGISEFIDHGRDGFLAADDTAMVSALNLLVTNPSIRATITAHNARVPAPFGWQETLARTALAYDRAATLQHLGVHDRRPQPIMSVSRLPVVAATVYEDVSV
jgi:glycosyltransferase involved in cell wall biosynthesis